MDAKKFSYKWSPEKQKEWSLKNLSLYIDDYIIPYSPFYRKRFAEAGIKRGDIRTAADVARIPLTLKTDFKEDIVAFVLQPKFPGVESKYDTAPIRKKDMLKYVWQALREPVYPGIVDEYRTLKARIKNAALREWFPIHFHASGGTTGDPSPALYTHYDLFQVMPYILSMAYMSGIQRDWKCLNLFPAAPHLAFFQTVFSQFLMGGNVFHTCGGHVIPTERQIEIAEKGKFEYLAAIPSYLTYWLDVARKMQEQGRIGRLDSFKFAVVAGEPMVPAYLEKLKRQFRDVGSDVKILEGYGMTEMKAAFYSCGENSGIHLNAEKYYWELLDPETRMPVPEGSPGVLTFSHAGFRGTALVRYYTGDLVNGLVWDKCPCCGIIGPRLVVPVCRAVKDFSKIKGARVSMLSLQTQIRSTPGVETFQVIITKEKAEDPFSRDWIKVFLAVKEGEDIAAVEREVRKNIKYECEISPSEVIFETSAEIEAKLFKRTGLKADWIIDERALSSPNTMTEDNKS